MSRNETRSALLEAGTQMILEGGFHHTGLQAVLSEAHVPKGSFYHYFESKDDFGLAVLDRYVGDLNAALDHHLGDTNYLPLTRLRRYFEAYVDHYQANGARDGCLIGNLSQELADQSEVFRPRLEDAFARWRDRLADCLAEAKAAGELRPDADATVLADFCLDGWEGALLRMKVVKTTAPLVAFLDVLFGALFQSEPPR